MRTAGRDKRPAVSVIPEGFEEYERWPVSGVVDFVRREVAARHWLTRGFFLLLYCMVLGGITVGVRHYLRGALVFSEILVPLGIGIFGMIALVPPHELLHGLAYKLVGAERVKYGADVSKLVFHASAPGYLMDHVRMYWVAFTPFVVITCALIISMVVVPSWYGWLLFGSLLAHTQGCIGDFAIAAFFARQAAPERWLTYDDAETGDFVLLYRH